MGRGKEAGKRPCILLPTSLCCFFDRGGGGGGGGGVHARGVADALMPSFEFVFSPFIFFIFVFEVWVSCDSRESKHVLSDLGDLWVAFRLWRRAAR